LRRVASTAGRRVDMWGGYWVASTADSTAVQSVAWKADPSAVAWAAVKAARLGGSKAGHSAEWTAATRVDKSAGKKAALSAAMLANSTVAPWAGH